MMCDIKEDKFLRRKNKVGTGRQHRPGILYRICFMAVARMER